MGAVEAEEHHDALRRSLAWDGCFNVRELGGLQTASGGRTRRGVVVRADNVRRLTGAGWQAALDHGVRRVVDLRFESEVPGEPDAPATSRWSSSPCARGTIPKPLTRSSRRCSMPTTSRRSSRPATSRCSRICRSASGVPSQRSPTRRTARVSSSTASRARTERGSCRRCSSRSPACRTSSLLPTTQRAIPASRCCRPRGSSRRETRPS